MCAHLLRACSCVSALGKANGIRGLAHIALSLLGKVLPMTIADTAQNGETKYVVESRVVWPEDKDGNIIKPSWWDDEEFNVRLEH